MGIDFPPGTFAPHRPRSSQPHLQHLLSLYLFPHSVNSVSIPFLQSFSENMRYVISLILIPSVFYSRSTTIPKFASLVAYVFFICLHSNLIFYNKPTDVKFLLFQLLILGKALYLLVDDMLEADRIARVSLVRKKSSIIAPASPTKVSQQQPA